jgi:hypothetical protein
MRYNSRDNPDHPLAANFSILDGRHVIKVPKVTPGNDYAIVLFGDSVSCHAQCFRQRLS